MRIRYLAENTKQSLRSVSNLRPIDRKGNIAPLTVGLKTKHIGSPLGLGFDEAKLNKRCTTIKCCKDNNQGSGNAIPEPLDIAGHLRSKYLTQYILADLLLGAEVALFSYTRLW